MKSFLRSTGDSFNQLPSIFPQQTTSLLKRRKVEEAVARTLQPDWLQSEEATQYFFTTSYLFYLYDMAQGGELTSLNRFLSEIKSRLIVEEIAQEVELLCGLIAHSQMHDMVKNRIQCKVMEEGLLAQRFQIFEYVMRKGSQVALSDSTYLKLLHLQRWSEIYRLLEMPLQPRIQPPQGRQQSTQPVIQFEMQIMPAPLISRLNANYAYMINLFIKSEVPELSRNQLFGYERPKQSPLLIPLTLAFIHHCFTRHLELHYESIIRILLSNRLEVEASFLLQQGVGQCISADVLSSALQNECYAFALEYIELFLNNPPSSEQEKRRLLGLLLYHFEISLPMIQTLIYFIKKTGPAFNSHERADLIQIIKLKLLESTHIDQGFLLCVRNPLKICILLIDLLNSLLTFLDPLRLLIYKLKEDLEKLARQILAQVRCQKKLRAILADRDITGRDLLTLISQNEEIDVLGHPFVKNLADEVWVSPYNSSNNPLVFNESYVQLKLAFKDKKINEDAQQGQAIIKKERDIKDKVYLFSYEGWKSGLINRFYFAVLLTLALTLVFQYVLGRFVALSFELSKAGDGYDQNERDQLSGLDNIMVIGCSPRNYTVNSDLLSQQTFLGFQVTEGDRFNNTIHFFEVIVCNLHEVTYLRDYFMKPISYITLLIVVHYVGLFYNFVKTRKPVWFLVTREIFVIDIILIATRIWELVLHQRVDPLSDRFDYTALSIYMDHGWLIKDTFMIDVAAFSLLLYWLRTLFHLKATPLFGPFIKVLLINFKHLLVWMIIFIICLMTASALLSTLLSQTEGCQTYKDCLYLLIEGSVGEVNFSEMYSHFHAQLIYSLIVIVFMVLFLSILIAQMTLNYNSIVKRGQLYYLKEILDMRYFFHLDQRYGSLVALDFPLSIPLSFLIIPIECLERRQRRIRKKSKTPRTHVCCCYCKVSKNNPSYKAIDLQDFNEVIFKLVHLFVILLMALAVFLVGIILSPFGYIALVMNQSYNIRFLCHSPKTKPTTYLTTRVAPDPLKQKPKCRIFSTWLVMLLFGLPYLLILNFFQTCKFMRLALKKTPAPEEKLVYNYKEESYYSVRDFNLFLDGIKKYKEVKENKGNDGEEEHNIKKLNFQSLNFKEFLIHQYQGKVDNVEQLDSLIRLAQLFKYIQSQGVQFSTQNAHRFIHGLYCQFQVRFKNISLSKRKSKFIVSRIKDIRGNLVISIPIGHQNQKESYFQIVINRETRMEELKSAPESVFQIQGARKKSARYSAENPQNSVFHMAGKSDSEIELIYVKELFREFYDEEANPTFGCRIVESFSLQDTQVGCEQFLMKLDQSDNWSTIKKNLQDENY